MNSLELLVCLLLVAFSAYLSASEIALFSLSRFQVKSIKDEFRNTHRTIKKLLADPTGLLITILIINEIINIALSSMITEAVFQTEILRPFLAGRLPSWGVKTLLGILISSPIILVLCEITPKVIAARLNRYIAILTVVPLNFLYEAFRPVRGFVQLILRVLSGSLIKTRKGNHSNPEKDLILKESDFLLMVEEGHKEGAIGQSEFDLIKNVFELDDTPVSEVTTPLSQVLTIPAHASFQEALAAFRDRKYSRIPVVSGDRKEIVGILYSKDLLRAKLDPSLSVKTVADLMRRPFFVRPSLRLNALFRKFKRQKIHMALVKESEGDVIGVVTMSDLLDAVFEDLFAADSFRPASKDTKLDYPYKNRKTGKNTRNEI